MWRNKIYIIIDKDSVKPILFWRFSGGDIVVMVVGFCIGFWPVKALFGDMIGLLAGMTIFIILGFLLMEMPNHLSILEHIKMFYEYKYKMPHEYFYIPKSIVNRLKQEVVDEETLEWNEYQRMIEENRNHSNQ